MTEVLVTGGAGFIGSHLQDRLLEQGHAVTVVDNLRTGKRDHINKRATFYRVDIRDRDRLGKVMKDVRPQIVFHLAAQNHVPSSLNDPREDQEINMVGMINLMEAVRDVGVEKVIYSNTGGALYGEIAPEQLPVEEDQSTYPTSFYGLSKLAAEHYLRLYGQIYGISWLSLRYSNVYGPRQSSSHEGGVISIFIKKLLEGDVPTINGDGSHTRDYVFVEDVVKANVLAMSHPNSDYFNISTATETSNLEVYQLITSLLDLNAPPIFGPKRPQDIQRSSLSNAKARQYLLWSPQTELKEGIEQTINYFINH